MSKALFGDVRHPKKRAFLAALAHSASIAKAAELAGIDRDNHYLWLKKDPEYKDAFRIAWDHAVDMLEAEAVRRAYEGTLKPVYHGGKRAIDVKIDENGKVARDSEGNAIGVPAAIREFSDLLLIFLLKAKRPSEYRENLSLSGPTGGAIEITDVSPRERLASRIAGIAARTGTREHTEQPI